MTEDTYTLYKLFLGDQDSTNGFYQVGYTIHSIEASIYSNGGVFSFLSLGRNFTYTPMGFTEYDVTEGDVIFDGDETYYTIKACHPWPNKKNFEFFALELEQLKEFAFIAGFFGFEDLEHGEIGCEFEKGFERGYWAL